MSERWRVKKSGNSMEKCENERKKVIGNSMINRDRYDVVIVNYSSLYEC